MRLECKAVCRLTTAIGVQVQQMLLWHRDRSGAASLGTSQRLDRRVLHVLPRLLELLNEMQPKGVHKGYGVSMVGLHHELFSDQRQCRQALRRFTCIGIYQIQRGRTAEQMETDAWQRKPYETLAVSSQHRTI